MDEMRPAEVVIYLQEPPRIGIESAPPRFITLLSVLPIITDDIYLVDTDADRAAIFVTDVKTDPPATASSLEMRISIALAIQYTWSCNLASASRLMGCG